MRKSISICILSLFALCIASCSSEDSWDYDVNDSDLQYNKRDDLTILLPIGINGYRPEAKIALTKKKNLPKPIVNIVNSWENESHSPYTSVFTCEWQGKTIYCIFSTFMPSLFLSYYENGEKVPDLQNGDSDSLEEFFVTSTDWKIVYCVDISRYLSDNI